MRLFMIEPEERQRILDLMEEAYTGIQSVYNIMGTGFSRLDEDNLNALASRCSRAAHLLATASTKTAAAAKTGRSEP